MGFDATESQPRRFSVHSAADAPSRGRLVDGRDFQDAALQFLEACHPEDAGDEAALMVEDCETGERQRLRVDLGTGAATPSD